MYENTVYSHKVLVAFRMECVVEINTNGDIDEYKELDTILILINQDIWKKQNLKSLYLKGDSLDIISGEVFGQDLKFKTIEGEKYYFFDLVEAEELINNENLNEEAAKRYILSSLKKEYASENGTELHQILPKMSPLNPKYITKKQSVFQKISDFVAKFKGVGGAI